MAQSHSGSTSGHEPTPRTGVRDGEVGGSAPRTAGAGPSAQADSCWSSLVSAASERYRRTDPHAHRFARAKLGGDRVFRQVLEQGLIAPGARVLDLGCGQGLLASLLCAAAEASNAGHWPAHWAAAPHGAHVTGIDPLPRDIQRGIAALGDAATFVHGDMRSTALPRCDVAVFFDTLHYIAPHEQDAVLARVREVLAPGGTVLMRVHDAASPLRFAFGRWVDRFTMLLHGGGFGRVAGRPLSAWTATLQRLGFDVRWLPMNGRPPFANLLIVGRLATYGP